MSGMSCEARRDVCENGEEKERLSDNQQRGPPLKRYVWLVVNSPKRKSGCSFFPFVISIFMPQDMEVYFFFFLFERSKYT